MTHNDEFNILTHMSKRLQVLFSEDEYQKLKRHARQARQTLGEWVRCALRRVTDQESIQSPEQRLKVLRHASSFEAPVSSIEEMEKEIESGYLEK